MADGTSDGRVVKNAMHRILDGIVPPEQQRSSRALSDEEKLVVKAIETIGQGFVQCCDEIGSSHELSLAKTKMEEAVMWATRHITKSA